MRERERQKLANISQENDCMLETQEAAEMV